MLTEAICNGLVSFSAKNIPASMPLIRCIYPASRAHRGATRDGSAPSAPTTTGESSTLKACHPRLHDTPRIRTSLSKPHGPPKSGAALPRRNAVNRASGGQGRSPANLLLRESSVASR
ncbi:hypothetical protein GCM10023191_021100 [Actinoallomurus oryzae]|uniref:Uncharacterized protein n=1 Tax=Actinoallomurus oryzae TaxID=502180 RepID=A0ABP8PLV9_9ACTN